MIFNMRLGRFRSMVHCMFVVAASDVRVMCFRLVLSCFVVLGGFLVMACRVFVMLCRFVMMLYCRDLTQTNNSFRLADYPRTGWLRIICCPH